MIAEDEGQENMDELIDEFAIKNIDINAPMMAKAKSYEIQNKFNFVQPFDILA